ncbi:uncharacterized protein LOC133822434 [Humulus lupulus]|uniref:uncharacterized protein LOC133822434 n=1 Tax=Humulus lupulus TaxID=3486 RepID=UPI002B4045E6|nr:uncharacterized protein LOC133822434 [Humulus lupulus]
MESPFFRNHWSNFKPRPRYSPGVREIPSSSKPSPNVVSIPVHFVRSERSRSDSALRVQKVFRGFLVRRSLKKIAAIKGEVDEIEKRMSRKETMELIRKDSKERLRLNESLMSLLFRLDSVKGVDSGVRDCRKTVIKKAIKLQERIDAIVTGAGGDEQVLETKETGECESLGDDADVDDDDKDVDHTPDLEPESAVADMSPESSADGTNSSEIEQDLLLEKEGQAPEIEEEGCDSELQNLAEPVINRSTAEEGSGESVAEPVVNKSTAEEGSGESVAEPVINPSIAEEGNGESLEEAEVKIEEKKDSETNCSNDTMSESGSSIDDKSPVEEDMEEETGVDNNEEEEEEYAAMEFAEADKNEENKIKKKSSKELLEKMMEENEKMMGLMADLYQRNEVQTRLLSSLTHRVEQLERAFICDKLRKKKMRRACISGADCNR